MSNFHFIMWKLRQYNNQVASGISSPTMNINETIIVMKLLLLAKAAAMTD